MKSPKPCDNALAFVSVNGGVYPRAGRLALALIAACVAPAWGGCQQDAAPPAGPLQPPAPQPNDGVQPSLAGQGAGPSDAVGPDMSRTTPFDPVGSDQKPDVTVEPTPDTDTGASWCQAKEILNDHCGRCHGAEPAFGAPMSLMSHGDLMAMSPVDGRQNLTVALERINDAQRPMPPTPNPRLGAAELSVLDAWAKAGAPAAECDGSSEPVPSPNDDDCIDCGTYTCEDGTPLSFLAHGAPVAGDETDFDASQIGGAATLGDPNSYQCFYFKAPWGPGQLATGFKPVIDNARIMHHWLLYASENAPFDITDGGMRAECQLQSDPNRVLLAGWAPGTPGRNFPADVGQELPHGPNTYVTLEIHYYNTKPGEAAPDRSGAELCMASGTRPNVATQHWLGTENINVPAGARGDASDVCTPSLSGGGTATLLAVTPHMHKLGSHAKLEVLRASGAVEVLHDGAFSSDNQTTYDFDPPITIQAGDKLRTTCTFQNTGSTAVPYGEGSDEEMCYLYVTAYPAGSLHNGRNGCFGPLCVPGGKRRCIDNENILHAANAL